MIWKLSSLFLTAAALFFLVKITNKFTISLWILHSLCVARYSPTELKNAVLLAVVLPRCANTQTTQWTWNTLGLVINDKTTFTTFICDFVSFFFFFLFSFLLRFHHRSSEWGYTIKYPIKFFCIFYNLMRDLCVRTFFSVQENIIQKEKNIHTNTETTHAHWSCCCLLARRALRVFPHTVKKRAKEKIKKSSLKSLEAILI